MSKNRVGEQILKVRTSKGVTQKVLGKKLGVNEKFINDVEQGKKIINEALITKIGKVLGVDLNDVGMVVSDADLDREKELARDTVVQSANRPVKKEEVNEVWSQAFGSNLKNVPILNYDLNKAVGHRQLSMSSNKIDGHTSDKVFYVKIEQNDMTGFRIQKGDLALCYKINTIENNTIALVEHKGERMIRQIKKLDSMKVLLVSNGGSMMTQTATIKELKPIATLYKVEFDLK
ncbi:helix-turn-helix transcriptional regulator [uncultured Clostridium sp.]|jgi:transcriptional regulator with XRE-family HTH domain|uniref:helix-turn-helix domain-containing protein n=1 Tax=uncultured Clostridium sp. TaxID=59620 RepID=UPI0026194BFB|nr:helix-turn-helix transcriptional regulator [uncultured Clostridium sp.]